MAIPERKYIELVGMNCAVKMLVPACNVALVDAVPLLTGTGTVLTIPPVNATLPIAVCGATFAVSMIEVPTEPVVGADSVIVVRVVG